MDYRLPFILVGYFFVKLIIKILLKILALPLKDHSIAKRACDYCLNAERRANKGQKNKNHWLKKDLGPSMFILQWYSRHDELLGIFNSIKIGGVFWRIYKFQRLIGIRRNLHSHECIDYVAFLRDVLISNGWHKSKNKGPRLHFLLKMSFW